MQSALNPASVVNGTGDIYTTNQSGIVRLVGGALWVMKGDGTYDPAGVRYGGNVYFHTADCSGTLYLGDVGPTRLWTTNVGVTDESGPYNNYVKSGRAAAPAGGDWSYYYSFGNFDAGCHSGGAPGNTVSAYAPTNDVPTAPAASTPPFTWVAN